MAHWTTIAIFAAAQGVFLSLCLLLIRRGNRQANWYLACLILTYSLWMAEFAAYFTEYLYGMPHALFATVGLPLLFGPCLLFYAKKISKTDIKTGPFTLHLLPFILHTIYYFSFFVQSADQKLQAIKELQNTASPPEFSMAFYTNESLKFLILLAYIIYTFRLYLKWPVNQQRKATDHIDKKWLGMLLIGLGFFAVFDLLHLLSLYLFAYDYLFILAKLILGGGAAILYFIGYATLKRPELISSEQQKQQPRYQKSSLPDDKIDAYKKEIQRLMDEEHIYTDSDFNLQLFASKLGLSTHHLSQLLNEYMQMSFHTLINQYRVQRVQKMLQDPAQTHLTILSIAYDAGFKSKASFNTVFKKRTGMTPSAYKKKYLVKES